MPNEPTEDTPVEPIAAIPAPPVEPPPTPESPVDPAEEAVDLAKELEFLIDCVAQCGGQPARNAEYHLRLALPHVQAMPVDTNV